MITGSQQAGLPAFARRLLAGALLLLSAAALSLPVGCGGHAPGEDDAGQSEAAAEPAPEPAPTVVPVVLPAPRPSEPLPEETSCVSAECHASYATARQIHGAISAGDCFTCHDPDQGDHVYPLKRADNDLCTFCHTTGTHRIHQHEAMESPGCTTCHEPHVSEAKFLLTAPSVQDLCESCHLMEHRAVAHGPYAVGECTACHEPHESNYASLLRGGDGADHCGLCHAETQYALANASYIHEPVLDGCTKCHDPHSADYTHALKYSIEEACFTCHEDLERQVAGAAAPHAAVFTAERCANCHDPHAAGRPKLLRARQDELCLQCHAGAIESETGRTIAGMGELLADREHLHGPVRAGECSACHNVHGASHARLLNDQFTSDFYSAFDIGSYALCFNCHASELALREQTTQLTDFRDGEKNLHFIHVNRERKGRSCKSCHDIHGSNLPRHIAETVPFEGSGWAMPIGFEKTETGGSCAPGCHVPEAYDRVTPVAPPPTAPRGGP